jgi:hypothetical protein
MKIALLIFALFYLQDETPLKPLEEFEVKLDFEFRDRVKDPNKVEMNQTHRAYEKSRSTGPLPYLFLNLRVLKQQPEEVRLRVEQNGKSGVMNKKFNTSTVIKLDMGFTDDIKDRVSPHEYTVTFLTNDKKPISKIIIFFEEDGTYIVNGQVRGKI